MRCVLKTLCNCVMLFDCMINLILHCCFFSLKSILQLDIFIPNNFRNKKEPITKEEEEQEVKTELK